jgi:hypothetical protein
MTVNILCPRVSVLKCVYLLYHGTICTWTEDENLSKFVTWKARHCYYWGQFVTWKVRHCYCWGQFVTWKLRLNAGGSLSPERSDSVTAGGRPWPPQKRHSICSYYHYVHAYCGPLWQFISFISIKTPQLYNSNRNFLLQNLTCFVYIIIMCLHMQSAFSNPLGILWQYTRSCNFEKSFCMYKPMKVIH